MHIPQAKKNLGIIPIGKIMVRVDKLQKLKQGLMSKLLNGVV